MRYLKSQATAWSTAGVMLLASTLLALQLNQVALAKSELEQENEELDNSIQSVKEEKSELTEELVELKEEVSKKDKVIKKKDKEVKEKEKEVKKKDEEIKKLKQVATQVKSSSVSSSSGVVRSGNGKTYTMQLTYYTAQCNGCTGRTASGLNLSQGQTTVDGHRIIAADTSILPLHSVVRITNPDGSSYTAVVKDRGGAIKGNRLDILTATKSEAYKNGRHNATVEVISYGDNKYRKVN